MKKIIITLITILSLSVSYAATASESLQNILNGIYSMKGNFTQKVYASGRVQTSKGTMAMQKPGKFRWVITSPTRIIMVSNGKLLWVYDKALAQVTINKINKNDSVSPAVVLSHRIQLLGNYFNVWEKSGWYYLNPKYKNKMLKQVQLKFSGNKLSRMWILDNLGQKSLLSFTHVQVNQKLNQSQFNFTPPKGVDVLR